MSRSDKRGDKAPKSPRVRALVDKKEAGFSPSSATSPREVSLPPADAVPSELDLAFDRTEVVDPSQLDEDFRRRIAANAADAAAGPPKKSPTGGVKFNPTRVNAVGETDASQAEVSQSDLAAFDDQRTEYIDPNALREEAARVAAVPPMEQTADHIDMAAASAGARAPVKNPFSEIDATDNDLSSGATSDWNTENAHKQPHWLVEAKRIDLPRPTPSGETATVGPAGTRPAAPLYSPPQPDRSSGGQGGSMKNFVRGVTQKAPSLPWGKLIAAGIAVFGLAFLLALFVTSRPATNPGIVADGVEENEDNGTDEEGTKTDDNAVADTDVVDEDEDEDTDTGGRRVSVRLSLVDDISGSGYANLDTALKKKITSALKATKRFTTKRRPGDGGLSASLWIKAAKVDTGSDVARAEVECSMAVTGEELPSARMFKTDADAETELPLLKTDDADESDPAYQRALQKAEGRLAARAVKRCGEDLAKQLLRHYEQRTPGGTDTP